MTCSANFYLLEYNIYLRNLQGNLVLSGDGLPTILSVFKECVNYCPDSVYIGDPLSRQCVACHPTCLTCSIQVDNCTSCQEGLALSFNACLPTCSPGLYIYNSQCIDYCIGPCLTCATLAISCTSCITPYLLYNHHCI